jgi:drug/metabolite transporter (DMT)-like permease
MIPLSNQKRSTTAYLALATVCFFWGTTYLASRIGVRYVSGLWLAGIRQTLAGVLVLGYFIVFKRVGIPPLRILGKLSLLGIVMLCVSNGLMTIAMEYVPSGMAAIIAALVPVWVSIFSYFLVKKYTISWKLVLGMLLGVIGIAGIFLDNLSDLWNPSYRFGILLILIASLAWAYGSVLSAKWVLGVHYIYGAGFQMLASGIAMITIAGIFRFPLGSAFWHWEFWSVIGYLVIFGSLLAYSAYIYCLNHLPPAVVSLYAYVNPIVAVVLGWLLLQEKLNAMMGLSCLITLLGVYLVNNAFNKQR